MAVRNHNTLPMYKVNSDLYYEQPNLCVPDNTKGFPYKFNTYQDVDEPVFDPEVHLDLEMPDFVKVFPNYSTAKTAPAGKLAYSKPFNLLSAEGLRVIRRIVERESVEAAPSRGSRIALKGMFYSSPFIRDMHTSPVLLDHVSAILGERVVVTHDLPSAPQINSSVPGLGGAAEFWHWDSITYVGNFIISDMTEMDGGELEIIKMEKYAGMKALTEGSLRHEDIERISYEAPGKMMLAQGSEILHHVTPISSKKPRVVVLFNFCAANVFQSDRMVMQTYVQEDRPRGNRSGVYEFFRGKSWVCGHALVGMAKVIPYTEDGMALAKRLRAVAHELERVADLVEEKTNDTIGFFDEENGKFEEDWIKHV